MLRYFVILKCEEKKRLRMLRYFVILKCEVKTLHAALLCDTEVCSGRAAEGGAGAHEAVACVAVAGAKGDVLQDALQQCVPGRGATRG